MHHCRFLFGEWAANEDGNQMKTLLKNALGALGLQYAPGGISKFTVGDVTFYADPCSVGLTPQGELTAKGALKLMRDRSLKDLRVLDVCCGVGIIGLTIFTQARAHGTVSAVGLSDINIFNLNSLRRTLKNNGLDDLLGTKIQYWLSDAMSGIPKGEKFDIIVSNPPHIFKADFQSKRLTPEKLGTFDANWDFHSAFYGVCHEHLTDRGQVWFLENGEDAVEEDFIPFIEKNPRLKYVERVDEPLVPNFFWMISSLK